jgi:hypothetical protein
MLHEKRLNAIAHVTFFAAHRRAATFPNGTARLGGIGSVCHRGPSGHQRIASGAKPRHILAVLPTQNAKPRETGVDFTDLE